MDAEAFDARAWLALDSTLRRLMAHAPLEARLTALPFAPELSRLPHDPLSVYGIEMDESGRYGLRSEP